MVQEADKKTLKLVSSDSHVNEVEATWERVQKQYGDRAPRVVWNPAEGEEGPYLVVGGASGSLDGTDRESCAMEFFGMVTGGLALDPNDSRASEKAREFRKNFRFEDWRGAWDPQARLKDMDHDGVEAEIIYASHLRHFYDISAHDEPFFRAIAQSYNEWLVDFCSYAPKRLNGLPVLSVLNPQGAVEDFEEYAKRGVKGFMIGSSVPFGMSYGDKMFDPLWAAAEEAGLPLHLHISTAKWKRPNEGIRATQIEIMHSLCEMIYGGVFDRFPKLKIVSAEFAIGWVGFWLEQLRDFPGRHHLELAPHEYLDRNIWFTFQDDRAGVLQTPMFGSDRFLWANDFPHRDCTWPDSRAIVDRQFEGISEETKRKIVRENAIGLYELDL